MLTKTRTYLSTAAFIFAIAGPVAADPAQFAVDHFNASADSVGDLRLYSGATGSNVTVSAMDGSPIGRAIELLNDSADSIGDLRGLQGVTIVRGTPAHGAEIFEQMRLESRGSD